MHHEHHDDWECLEDMVLKQLQAQRMVDRLPPNKELDDWRSRRSYWEQKIEQRMKMLRYLASRYEPGSARATTAAEGSQEP